MKAVWPAVLLLAGCGVAAPAASRTVSCGGGLRAGVSVAPSRLGAVHFLSPEAGLGLTSSRLLCRSRLRSIPVLLAVTRDGGRDWITEGTPLPLPLPPPPQGGFIEQLAASTPSIAWASSGAGPLWATTDGGKDWTVQPVPGPVSAVAITGRTLWALGCPHRNNVQCHPVLTRKRLPSGRWRRLPLPKLASDPYPLLAAPPGQVIVVPGGPGGNGSDKILASADGGLSWRVHADPSWMGRPCQIADLTSAGRARWWLLCLGGAAAGSSTKGLLQTTSAGRTWETVSQVTSLTAPWHPGSLGTGEPNAMAAGSTSRVWLCFQNWMTESDDAGRTWTVLPGIDPQGMPAAFDVLSPSHAWLLAAGQGLWRTTDGRHWRAL